MKMMNEKVRLKAKIIDKIENEEWDELIKMITQNIDKFLVLNAFYLNQLIEILTKIKIDWERMKDYEKKHYKEMLEIMASKL